MAEGLVELDTIAELSLALIGFSALLAMFRGGSIHTWQPRTRVVTPGSHGRVSPSGSSSATDLARSSSLFCLRYFAISALRPGRRRC
jgi:hypothetical protein